MRRTIAMLSVLGGLGAGLGCQHIAGKCDCQAHPSDAVLAAPTPPYATIPVEALPTTPVIPKADPNGKGKTKSDEKPETPKPEKNPESEEAAPTFKPSAEMN